MLDGAKLARGGETRSSYAKAAISHDPYLGWAVESVERALNAFLQPMVAEIADPCNFAMDEGFKRIPYSLTHPLLSIEYDVDRTKKI